MTKAKNFYVKSTQSRVEIFNAICELLHLDRSDIVNILIKDFVLNAVQQDSEISHLISEVVTVFSDNLPKLTYTDAILSVTFQSNQCFDA